MVSLECDEVVPSHEAPVQNPSPETLSACGESLDLVSVLERLDLMCRKEVRAAPRPDRSGMPRGPQGLGSLYKKIFYIKKSVI